MKTQISHIPELNANIYNPHTESVQDAKHPAEDIPGLERTTFSLSVPYHLKDQVATLVHADGSFGGRDFFYQWKEMTPDVARDMTTAYLRNKGLEHVVFDKVVEQIFETPQPSPTTGGVLNAFYVEGRAYRMEALPRRGFHPA